MNDGPVPLGYGGGPLNPGIQLRWSPPPTAVGFTVCRGNSASSCTSLTPTRIAPPASGDVYFVDQDIPPGSTQSYFVTSWRADGHYGVLGPLTYQAGTWPAPANFRVLQDLSSQAELVLGWDPVGYLRQDNTPAQLNTYIVTGAGFPTAQTVTGTQIRVRLTSAGNSWQVAPAYPNPAGGIFTSATPATLSYEYGRYRLVALGFKALQASDDDVLARDGQGDEVYFAAVVNETDRALTTSQVSTARTTTYGDVGNTNAFPGRVQAGTVGAAGGIRSGDLVPISLDLSAPGGTPNSQGFPLLLWQGSLNSKGMVVVHPTLWEEDLDRTPYGDWEQVTRSDAGTGYSQTNNMGLPGGKPGGTLTVVQAMRDQDDVGSGMGGMQFECDDLLVSIYAGIPRCKTHGTDRAIGLRDHDTLGFIKWHNHLLVLTYASVEKVLNSPPARPGVATGLLVVPLYENGVVAKAMYEIYLRLERLP